MSREERRGRVAYGLCRDGHGGGICGGKECGLWTGDMGVGDTLERLGIVNGATHGDAVAHLKVGKGNARGGKVVAGSVVFGKVHNVLRNLIAVGVAVGSGLPDVVGKGADTRNDARDGLAGVDGVGARDNHGILGGFGILHGANLGIKGGKDGIAERAKRAASGVSRLNSLHAVGGKGGVLLFVLGRPESKHLLMGEDFAVFVVGLAGPDGLPSLPRVQHGADGFGGGLVPELPKIIAALRSLVPLGEAVGAVGDHGGNVIKGVANRTLAEDHIFGAARVFHKEGLAVGFKESGRGNAEVFLGASRANLDNLARSRVKEEEVGLAVSAGSVAVVAVVGTEVL